MECPNCRNTIPDTSTFCAYCGATITPPAAAAPSSGSSRRWLFIGGGIAAIVVVVVVVVVAVLILGGGDPEPSQAVLPVPPATPLPEAAAAPADRPVAPPTAMPAATPVPQSTTAPLASAPSANSDKNIIFSDLDWTSAKVQTRIAQYLVEHGYRYRTALMSGSTDHLFRSLRDGEVHVAMEIWLPLQDAAWREALSNGEVAYGGVSLGDDWQSTFVIPKYLQEEYPGLDHVDDLKDPRYRELFATTNGKARLVGCVVGWACETGNQAQIEGYGLTDHLQVVKPDSEADLFNELYDAYAKRKPWLGYMWGTADPALLLDLVQLEEPPYSDECWYTTQACAFKDSTILTAVHSEVTDMRPEVIHLLINWGFTTEEYQAVFRWMDSNGATVEEAALNWLMENGDTWRGWVTAEAVVGVQTALDAGVPAAGWPR